MLEQPIQAPNIIQSISQIKSQKSQNTLRHRYWLMLQCQFWIYHLFITSLSLYLVYQFIKIDAQANSVYSTEQYRYGQQTIDFWKKGYIIDIKQVNTDNCPQGYTEVINYVWPGTYDGCACRTIVNSHASQYIMTGACTSELISYGCTTISAVSKKIMKMWKGGKLLCYKRINSLNFYNSTLATTPDGTNTPMKKCAINKSYQVTTLPQITCPQTVISNTSVGTSTQTVLNLDQLNTYNLYYQNQQSYPIVDFKLTEYKFCAFFNQTNISPDKNGNYILEVMNISETCNGTDPRAIEFDYMTEQAFYTNNKRIYALLSSLPGYPRPSISYYYKLGFYRYPAWTTSCRNSQTHNLLITTQHLNFSHITQKTKLILYVGVPCMILISILIRILYIIRHIFQLKSKKQYNMLILTDQEVGQQIPNLNIIKSFKKQVFFCIFQLLLLAGTTFILAFGAYQFINESIWIKQSYNKNCTQEHLNWIFRHNQQKVDTCNYLTGLSIMFTLVIFIVEIIHFVIRSKYGDLKQIEIKVQQSQSNEGLIKDDLDEKKNNMVADQNINLQDSSDIILRKQKQQLKIYDLDNFMSNQLQGNNAGQTGFNFYAQQSVEIQNYQLGKKKKKKGIKRKNLFKQGQQK